MKKLSIITTIVLSINIPEAFLIIIVSVSIGISEEEKNKFTLPIFILSFCSLFFFMLLAFSFGAKEKKCSDCCPCSSSSKENSNIKNSCCCSCCSICCYHCRKNCCDECKGVVEGSGCADCCSTMNISGGAANNQGLGYILGIFAVVLIIIPLILGLFCVIKIIGKYATLFVCLIFLFLSDIVFICLGYLDSKEREITRSNYIIIISGAICALTNLIMLILIILDLRRFSVQINDKQIKNLETYKLSENDINSGDEKMELNSINNNSIGYDNNFGQ